MVPIDIETLILLARGVGRLAEADLEVLGHSALSRITPRIIETLRGLAETLECLPQEELDILRWSSLTYDAPGNPILLLSLLGNDGLVLALNHSAHIEYRACHGGDMWKAVITWGRAPRMERILTVTRQSIDSPNDREEWRIVDDEPADDLLERAFGRYACVGILREVQAHLERKEIDSSPLPVAAKPTLTGPAFGLPAIMPGDSPWIDRLISIKQEMQQAAA